MADHRATFVGKVEWRLVCSGGCPQPRLWAIPAREDMRLYTSPAQEVCSLLLSSDILPS
jgi:hypothetical protein